MSFGKNKSVGLKMSTWTPQSDKEAADHMFKERKELITKWWSNWNTQKRGEVMSAMIGLCSNKQIHLLQEKLDERFPTDRIDFTRDLPRTLALRILSKLDPRSLSRCSQVSWYWKWLAESDELWKPKCLRFGWVPPYKPSQFEHGAWKHFYILKVAESGVKLIPKEQIPDPAESAREVKKKKKQKPAKVWEPPPWRSNAPRPVDINRNNYLDNSNFSKTKTLNGSKSLNGTKYMTNTQKSIYSRPGSRPGTARSRMARSPTRSVRPNSVQTAHSVQKLNYSSPSQLNNDTIANFEQVLDSARSIREAPLTQHQLHLTQQMEDIGAPGYGNKAVPSLDFGALTLSDNLIQDDVDQLQTNSWSHQVAT